MTASNLCVCLQALVSHHLLSFWNISVEEFGSFVVQITMMSDIS